MLVVPSLFFGGSMLSRLMQPLNALGKKKNVKRRRHSSSNGGDDLKHQGDVKVNL
jgi:hypothetical protein